MIDRLKPVFRGYQGNFDIWVSYCMVMQLYNM